MVILGIRPTHLVEMKAIFATVWTLTVVFLAACGEKSDPVLDELLSLAPDLPYTVAEKLIVEDDSTFAVNAKELGSQALTDAWVLLHQSIAIDRVEEYEHSRAVIWPLLARIAGTLNNLYGTGRLHDAFMELSSLSEHDYLRYRRLRARKERLVNVMDLSIDDKCDSLLEFKAEFLSLGLPGAAIRCELAISALHARLGHVDLVIERNRAIVPELYAAGDYVILCQVLGSMGYNLEQRGDLDSMRVCWNEALRIAGRHRIPVQAARITSFYANHYVREGRLQLAEKLFDEAIRICRDDNAREYELRFVTMAMRRYAELGAWEVVGRLLPRAHVLLRFMQEMSPSEVEDLTHEVGVLEARLLMASGQWQSAVPLFAKAVRYERETTDRFRTPTTFLDVLYYFARGLVDNGRPQEAFPLIDEALELARTVDLVRVEARMSLLAAKASELQFDHEAALGWLERFDVLAQEDRDRLRDEWMERDVLLMGVQTARGDRSSALACGAAGISRLEDYLSRLEPSVQAYLWMGRCDALRESLHELFREEASLGYGLELFWRRLSRSMGRVQSSQPRKDLTPELRKLASQAAGRVRSLGGVHCVFAEVGNEIWRWTVDGGDFQLNTLAADKTELSELVSSVWGEVANSQRSGISADPPSGSARALAAMLIPQDTTAGPLYVTASGVLARFPFETLDVGSSASYEPLLKHRDVVYVRYFDEDAATRPATNALVVVSASGDLEHAAVEGRRFASRYGNGRLLTAENATKMNVISQWEEAGVVYIASHVLRRSDASYVALIPLPYTEEDGSPDEGYLDIRDIRSADFSGCDLVVLSGCSSGDPYVGRSTSAPSLSDAFLDAGAGAVVQTFWDIRDDDARAVMSLFLDMWMGKEMKIQEALSAARRQLVAEGGHPPSTWAAYSVKLGRL